MRKRSKAKTTSQREAEEDDELADPEVFARHKNNTLKFWRMCREPRCRRGKACLGEAQPCFTRHWALMPEHEKMWLRFAIKARAAGATPQEAMKAGNDARERYLKELAEPDPRFIPADSGRR